MSLLEIIPNIQFLGDRGNIIGFVWLFLMGYFAYKTLRLHYQSHWFYSLALGVGLAYLLHVLLDEIVNMAYIVSGSPFVFGYPKYLSLNIIDYLRIRFKNYLTLTVLPSALLYKGVHKHFQITHWTLFFMVLVCFKDFYQASNRFVDYAGLSGPARVETFWTIYPISYILYSLLFLSILKRSKAL